MAPLGLHDPKETHLKTSPTTLKVIGTILLLLGYVDCIILTLVCRSWIFWQEAIFTFVTFLFPPSAPTPSWLDEARELTLTL